MAKAFCNSIDIEYDTFGTSEHPAILLISRLGGQLLDWDESICRAMADHGYFVIRYDNRDSGLSSKIVDPEPGATAVMFKALMKGEKIAPLYSFEDMADDAAGLLDVLGIQQAHVCGISMGGAIAQTMAMRHFSRVKSLILIYSATGNPDLSTPDPEAAKILFEPAPAERTANIDHMLNVFKAITGSGIPFDTAAHRELAGRYFDRAFCPQGTAHQLIAALTQQNRTSQLAQLTTPALVIHGDDDPLMPLAAGRELAETLPNAELVIVKGLGHDLPMMNAHWKNILNALIEFIQNVK